MGGWFRKEMQTVDDLKGVKMRIAGLGGEVMARLGAVPQQIAGGDIYPALERGTIDAAEWVGPYDDEKLGFYKIAPHYYFPGWWEADSMYSLYVNIKEWEKLPKEYQAAIEAASYEANTDMMAKYDFKNPQALERLVKNGVKLHAFSPEIMAAAHKAAFELYEEEAGKNPAWKKIYEPWKKFRQDEFLWHRGGRADADHLPAQQPGSASRQETSRYFCCFSMRSMLNPGRRPSGAWVPRLRPAPAARPGAFELAAQLVRAGSARSRPAPSIRGRSRCPGTR